MVKIFISLSSKDKGLVEVIDYNLRNVGITPIIEEFSEVRNPPYENIKGKIIESAAVFLWLTPTITESKYTKSWVICETIIAANQNKPVYVFEKWDSDVQLPIPYVTDYILYDPSQKEHWRVIQEIAIKRAREYSPHPAALVGGIIGGLLGLNKGALGALLGAGIGAVGGEIIGRTLDSLSAQKEFPLKVICRYCRWIFNFYSEINRFRCPHCRHQIEIKRESLE